MYWCGSCKRTVNLKPEDPVRCPFCGHKILFKERPGIVKRVRVD